MRLVIDSNKLEDDALQDWLSRSKNNQAVMTDFVAMEAYKGNTLAKIFKSMEIISKFPDQVIILKGSRRLFGISGRVKGLQRRLIDEDQTRSFSKYVRQLRLARNGNQSYQKALLAHGKAADKHFQNMLLEAAQIKASIGTMSDEYTREEKAALRAKQEYPSSLINKIICAAIELSANMVKSSGLVHRWPTFEDLPNTYYFRAALAIYLMSMSRAAHGDITNLRPDKLRNDFVDMTLVAAASFFDGILSDDARVNEMFNEVTLLLSGALDANVPFFEKLLQKSIAT